MFVVGHPNLELCKFPVSPGRPEETHVQIPNFPFNIQAQAHRRP